MVSPSLSGTSTHETFDIVVVCKRRLRPSTRFIPRESNTHKTPIDLYLCRRRKVDKVVQVKMETFIFLVSYRYNKVGSQTHTL